MKLSDILVPPDWETATQRVLAGANPVLVLGAGDSGKSTLARYLLGRLVKQHGAAVLLDGDVGMTTVGPPGLLGLSMVPNVDALSERRQADRSWFVGSNTPTGLLLRVVMGHARLMRVARDAGLPVVINTSGLVSGSEGKDLQLGIIDAVEPALVLGLQKDDEIEHLLRPLELRGAAIERLKPSPRARTKPPSEKAHQRSERFERYFEASEETVLELGKLALEGTLLGSGRPLDERQRREVERHLDAHVVEGEGTLDATALVLASAPHEEGATALARALGDKRVHVIEAAQTEGLLIGLLAADGECLGLGILRAWEGSGAVTVLTPLAADTLLRVARLSLGSLRLARSGREIGRWGRERVIEALKPEEAEREDIPSLGWSAGSLD